MLLRYISASKLPRPTPPVHPNLHINVELLRRSLIFNEPIHPHLVTPLNLRLLSKSLEDANHPDDETAEPPRRRRRGNRPCSVSSHWFSLFFFVSIAIGSYVMVLAGFYFFLWSEDTVTQPVIIIFWISALTFFFSKFVVFFHLYVIKSNACDLLFIYLSLICFYLSLSRIFFINNLSKHNKRKKTSYNGPFSFIFCMHDMIGSHSSLISPSNIHHHKGYVSVKFWLAGIYESWKKPETLQIYHFVGVYG